MAHVSNPMRHRRQLCSVAGNVTPVPCCAVSVSGRCLRRNCVFTEPRLQRGFADKMLSRFSFHFSRALCSVL